MKGLKILVPETGLLLLVGLLPICGVSATTSSTPYHRIVERNAFDLRTPVVIATSPAPNPIVRPKITLTGITTIFGRTIAFITIAGNKPGQPPESVMLAEGQGGQEVEVKTIDYKSGIVQVINHGQAQTLDFDGVLDPFIIIDKCPLIPFQPMPRSEAPLTPEEQVALIEIQREKFRQESNPIRSLLPPTVMSVESAENAFMLR